MNLVNVKISTAMLGLLSASALFIGSAQAETRGYVTDSSGEIIRDSAGNCWHGSDWTPEDATVVGCDGVELDTSATVIRGQGTGVFADITIPAASMFAFDKSDMTEEGKTAADEYIKVLGPELTDAYAVLVVGHTDSSGDESYNQALSQKRAQSMADYLVAKGVSPDSLRVIGRGSKEPLVSNDTLEGRKQNRRVDVLAIAEVRALDAMVFPSVALFERRSGELSAEGMKLLEKNRVEARQQFNRATYVEIVWHTDNVGEDDYNLELSKQRARSVRDYLVIKGLDGSKVITRGMFESRPIASNSTPEGRAENRRVEILMLGRIKE